MVKTFKIHQKFHYYWTNYQPKDLYKVCKQLVILMKPTFKNQGYVEWVKCNWGQVCSFLISWEGK